MTPDSVRTRRNVVWSGLDFAVLPLGMLIATPVLIKYLGLEQFGVLVLVNALIGFGALFNFGFGDTTLKYVSHYIGLGQTASATAIVRTIGLLALVSGGAVAVLFMLLVPAAAQVFNVGMLSHATDALYVAAIVIPLRLVESVYVATLRGCYRYELAAYATISTKGAMVATHMTLAILGFDLPGLLQATAIASAISVFLLLTFCSRHIGNILPGFSREALSEIGHYSFWSWLQGLAGVAYANVDRLLVSALLGPTALGIYGACMQLAQSIHVGLAALSHSLFARISILNSGRSKQQASEDSQAALRDLYVPASRAVSVPAVLAGSVLAVFSHEVLEMWVGHEIAEQGSWVLALLAMSFSWFAANSIVAYYTLNGLGKARMQAGVSVVGAVLMISSCFLLTSAFSLVGAAACRLPDVLFRIGVRMYVGRRVIGRIGDAVALDCVRITAIAIPCGLLLKALIQWYVGEAISLARLDVVGLIVGYIAAMYWLLEYMEKILGGKSLLVPGK